MTNSERTYGCNDCQYLTKNQLRCRMWNVKVAEPDNSHCEVVLTNWGKKIGWEHPEKIGV